MTVEYNKKIHRMYDAPGKRAVAEYLARTYPEHDFQEGSQYGIDLVCLCPKGPHFIEVEVKGEWFGRPFPYRTVHIPERKEKWFNMRATLWVVSSDYKYAVVVSPRHCTKKITLPYNSRSEIPEDFYDVPLSKCNQLVL